MKNKLARWIMKSAIIAPAFLAMSAFAQQTATTTTGTTTAPGVPSTGLGGELAINLVLMAIAAMAIVFGAVQMRKKA